VGKKKNADGEVSSPAKKKQPRSRTKVAKTSEGSGKEKAAGQDGIVISGQKRKSVQVYKAKTTPLLTAAAVNPLAVVIRDSGPSPAVGEVLSSGADSSDSNKKRKSETFGSADQAGAAEQPHHTQ
jgi:hypothetical protein